MPSDKEAMERLKELLAKATALPWIASEPGPSDEDVAAIWIGPGPEVRGATFAEDMIATIWSMNKSDGEFSANAALIVAAVNALPVFIAEREGLEAKLAVLSYAAFLDGRDNELRCSRAVYQEIRRLRDARAAEPHTEGWRCFQCSELFTDKRAAEGHFGKWPHHPPACAASDNAAELKTAYNHLEADFYAMKARAETAEAQREGREREVARLTADVSYWEAYEDGATVRLDALNDLVSDAQIALTTLCARYGYEDDGITPKDWSEWQEARRVHEALRALLHPTVPVESEPFGLSQGSEAWPDRVPVQDVAEPVEEEPDSYAADDMLMTLEAARQLQQECNCYPGRHVKDFRRAVVAALHVVPLSQGDGTQDLELAAADNNHDALVEALIAEHWFIDPDWGHWGLHKPMDPRRFIKLLLTAQPHPDVKGLVEAAGELRASVRLPPGRTRSKWATIPATAVAKLNNALTAFQSHQEERP